MSRDSQDSIFRDGPYAVVHRFSASSDRCLLTGERATATAEVPVALTIGSRGKFSGNALSLPLPVSEKWVSKKQGFAWGPFFRFAVATSSVGGTSAALAWFLPENVVAQVIAGLLMFVAIVLGALTLLIPFRPHTPGPRLIADDTDGTFVWLRGMADSSMPQWTGESKVPALIEYENGTRRLTRRCAIAGWAIVLILGALAASKFSTESAASSWPQAKATVVSSEIVQERRYVKYQGMKTYYLPLVRYEYSVNGQQHTGDKIALGGIGSKDESEINAYLRTKSLAPGKEITLYYNPAKPAEALVDPSISHMPYGRGFAAVIVALPSAGLLWLSLQSSRRIRNLEQYASGSQPPSAT